MSEANYYCTIADATILLPSSLNFRVSYLKLFFLTMIKFTYQDNLYRKYNYRCLNKHLLAVVLSYLDVNGGVNLVCRYWSLLMVKNRKHLQSGAEIVYREKPTKYSYN